MLDVIRFKSALGCLVACAAYLGTCTATASPDTATEAGATSQDRQHTAEPNRSPRHSLDRSGRKRTGKASFYASKFAGRKMADGTAMHPHGNNAASKTLPLGTTAKVTNLETGQSAVVTIQDRGPYVKGRIVDLSPATAQKIGIEGMAKVEVAPIAVPQSDGSVKAGAAATKTK